MIKATLLNLMGDDLDVVKDAKVSFDNDETVNPWGCYDVSIGPVHREQPILTEGQRSLIKYLVRGMPTKEYEALLKHPDRAYAMWKFRNTPTHAAPFGHGYLKFAVEAPVFVARQLVKHKFLRMSEISRRYVKGAPVYYKPDSWAGIAENIKQGAGDPLPVELQQVADEVYESAIAVADHDYAELLKYVAPEEARMVLPLCHMTRWVWSGSLDAMMNMCVLRLDDHAQSQTRIVARDIGDVIKMAFPQSWASYVEGDI